MKRRICMVLALMIALMLSVCAVADEYEVVDTVPEEDTQVISAGSVEEEVDEAKEADLDDLPEVEPEEESTEAEKTPEQPVIEEQHEEEKTEEEKPTVEEEPAEEESIKEEPAEGEPAEGEPTEEKSTEKESAEEQPVEEKTAEEEPAEEKPVEEKTAEEEASEAVVAAEPVEEEPEAEAPVANALTYTGEAQTLVSAQGAWLYSLDGENYGEDIPAAVDAGEYTVYFKADMDAEPETLTVKVAKADVTFTPPVAAFIEE